MSERKLPTIYTCFPGGKHKVLTMSYDDGKLEDRRLVSIFNKYTTHIIRQAAVGVGYITATLDHYDLRVFIQTADAGGGRSTARHTAYDHNFHLAPSTIATISDLG